MSELQELVKDLPVAAVAGYVGTKATEPVSEKLYEWEPKRDREREDAVRPGPPFQIAAENTLRLLGIEADETPAEQRSIHSDISIRRYSMRRC